MKKALLIGASLVVSLGTAAQTLNVVVGEVTYKIPASQAGSMDYADGSRLTILGKTFQLEGSDPHVCGPFGRDRQ